MSKALYILEYQLNVQYDRFEKADGFISVTAETYDEACQTARARLPKEKGEVKEYGHYGGYEHTNTYKHAFRLKDCLDENHDLFVPSTQEINVDNSSASYSSSVALSHRSIFG